MPSSFKQEVYLCSLQSIKEQLEVMSMTHGLSAPLDWAVKYDLRPAIDAVDKAIKRVEESVKKD